MATSVKASASSTLKVTSGISISTSSHTNTGITAAAAPVLLTVQADRVVTPSELAALVANGNADISNAFAARILNLVNEVVADIVDESVEANRAPTIDLGWGKFIFEIGGSLATATGTPTLVTNPCYFTGSVDPKYQAQFRLISATATGADNPCDISRVRDAETGDPNTIYGTDPFYVDGRGLVWGSATDKQALYDALGATKVCDLVLTTASSYANSMKCALPSTATVPVGTYLVKIDCTIGGTVYPMTRKVTVAEAVEPPSGPIAVVRQEGRPDNTVKLAADSPCTCWGEGLDLTAADKVLIECWNDAETEKVDEADVTSKITETSPIKIILSGFTGYTQSAATWADSYPHTKIVLVKNGTRYPFTLRFVEN